ncbi:MAG: SIMPL domain-containing protein [Candidatus Tantalella remota]|nr:SIMPL domain-containing protein [Candidatus Tantalella remota]
MKKTVLIVLTLASTSLLLTGCQQITNYSSIENSVPTLSAQGTGKIETTPDEAIAQFGVTSDSKSLSKAYKDNTEKMNAVISAVKTMGVEARDIQTSSYQVMPLYPRDENGRQIPGKPSGFKVRQQLTVKIRDIGKTGDVIDKVIASGSNTFNNLSFDSSKIEDLKKEAKSKAAKDAREQAEFLAKNIGVKIGKVLKVNASSIQPYYARNVMAFESAKARSPQIEAGSMEVSANCNVVFEIIQD